MVITQLNIEAFGSLKDRVIDLRSGMNIIAVNNEEIRETNAAFVLAMLYGMDRNSRAISPDSRPPHTAGSSGYCRTAPFMR